ncbi:gamma-glutamyl-gamma-aminobutyrate hydrolase family protein [bacterium]|nr:gamma-glutamyl-gamma-aminobutyrate hydrolase family protein [bacterium]|tara:strand:+ start:32597 stop:33262 length:666 start_codon:yes stop_codon:yes gene_type:complete
MKKKIVGITCDIKGKFYESEIAYSEMIIKSGGIPFYLPMTTDEKTASKIISFIDSLLITGSRDIDPTFYGEKKSKFINPLDKNRTLSELLLISLARKKKKKILGICGGMQLLNVALGGTLHQDIKFNIPDAIKHSDGVTHKIKIFPGTFLYKLFKKTSAQVNSYHHQSINILASPLIVSAETKDHIVEAFEDKNGKVLGVQWHPEISKKKIDFSFFNWLRT